MTRNIEEDAIRRLVEQEIIEKENPALLTIMGDKGFHEMILAEEESEAGVMIGSLIQTLSEITGTPIPAICEATLDIAMEIDQEGRKLEEHPALDTDEGNDSVSIDIDDVGDDE